MRLAIHTSLLGVESPPMPLDGFQFGPFLLDPKSKRLRRDGVQIPLAARHFDLLHLLVRRAGESLTKEALMQAVWQDGIVTEHSLTQAMWHVRQLLDPAEPQSYIATVHGKGYRFDAAVAHVAVLYTPDDLKLLAAPHRALTNGRAALERLDRANIARARETFGHLVALDQDNPQFRVGLANALALAYETTRTEGEPDTTLIARALEHVGMATSRNPHNAEVAATMGFVSGLAGDRINALAAHRRSVTIEPNSWQHHLRRAWGSWGGERLRAVADTLEWLPECAAARWLAASVLIARSALEPAEREVDAGLAELEHSPTDFAALPLQWLKGLMLLARGDEAAALAALERARALEPHEYIYSRECAASAWYATGAIGLRHGDRAGASAAFKEVLTRVPRHAMAQAGLAITTGARPPASSLAGPMTVDEAMARAALLVADGDVTGAVALVLKALEKEPDEPATSAGWLIPLDPLLDVQKNRDAWRPVLSRLRKRAK